MTTMDLPRAGRRELGAYVSDGPVLRSLAELADTHTRDEGVSALTRARVAYANYDLLRRDFPHLRAELQAQLYPEVAGLDAGRREQFLRRRIDDWLIENAAFVSICQAEQTEVNTPIHSRRSGVMATRPLAYGRALVFSIAANRRPGRAPRDLRTEAEGLLDVKGVGCAPDAKPKKGTHLDGLLKLSDALLELLNQQVIEAIFRHARSGFSTVPTYAIIDPGFDIRLERDRTTPAGILVRRAHIRPIGSAALPKYGTTEQIVQLEVDLLLRRYGITSSNSITTILFREEGGELRVRYGRTELGWLKPPDLKRLAEVARFNGAPMLIDGVNVQLTRAVSTKPLSGELIDFGTYRVRESFDRPLLSLVADRLLRWGGSIHPGEPRFTVPDPSIRVPCERWGPVPGGNGETYLDVLCAALAQQFSERTLDRTGLIESLDAMLTTATSRWRRAENSPASGPRADG